MYRLYRILFWLKLSFRFALFGDGGKVVRVITLLLFALTLTAAFAGIGENVDINIGSLERQWFHAYRPFVSVISGSCLFLWIVFSSGKAWAKTTPRDLHASCDNSDPGTFYYFLGTDFQQNPQVCEGRRIAIKN